MAETARLREEASELLRRLVACDTSNPPGRETQAAAIVEDYLVPAGVECERIAKDPDRANLVARIRGSGDGPSLAFLGHLDVVQAKREDWSVEPFAAIERDGEIWGRGTVDMKCQVAATAVALATLAREGFRPRGDLMLILTSDEEVGDDGVGAPYLVEQLPDLCPDFLVGEGAGERIQTPAGPIYLLDCGSKASSTVTLTVRGRPGDSSLPGVGDNAAVELARLISRLADHRFAVTVPPELEELLDLLAPGETDDETRVARARDAHPALDALVGALTRTHVEVSLVEAGGPLNVVPEQATATIQALVLPGTTKAGLEAELREALGEGSYELDVEEPLGGSTTPADTPLRAAIEAFLAERDPEARLVPALGFGFSDCHFMREAYGTAAYGFIPFPNADPITNLTTKHAIDERVRIDDLVFQAEAAMSVARALGATTAAASAGRAGPGSRER
jgi:acetylornithine deacetylase/succinyl-diaminopimelate desuccinylase-like protein